MVKLSAALSFLVVVLCIVITLTNEKGDGNGGLGSSIGAGQLKYDFYRHSCPSAEKLIRSEMIRLYEMTPSVAPAMLRLIFHDCFVQGCDASILLDSVDGERSEKDTAPNKALKGFDVVETIKSKLEATCPGVVSCADIIVVAARESVLLAGGPFYPLVTGRRDAKEPSATLAGRNLPGPDSDHRSILEAFHARGFDEQETVSLLGSHSVGNIHCSFFQKRLHNFSGTTEPDPTMNSGFVEEMRAKCTSSPSPGVDPAMKMDYEGPKASFGSLYYRSLLQGRGMLFADQQLTAGEATATWVKAYASDVSLFKRDFGSLMFKMSNLNVLTGAEGEVRLNCSRKN